MRSRYSSFQKADKIFQDFVFYFILLIGINILGERNMNASPLPTLVKPHPHTTRRRSPAEGGRARPLCPTCLFTPPWQLAGDVTWAFELKLFIYFWFVFRLRFLSTYFYLRLGSYSSVQGEVAAWQWGDA